MRLRLRTAGAPRVLFHQRGEDAHILGPITGSRSTEARLQLFSWKSPRSSIDVGDAAAHAGGEVAAAAAQHHDHAAGHVLAAVIAHAFDHGGGAGVAHREALAGHAAEVRLAAGGAVEHHVADDDVLLRPEGRIARRIDDDASAGEPLADVVVGVAFQRHA